MKAKKKKKVEPNELDILLPEDLNIPDPLDDVKDKKIDRSGRIDIPDPLDDVRQLIAKGE